MSVSRRRRRIRLAVTVTVLWALAVLVLLLLPGERVPAGSPIAEQELTDCAGGFQGLGCALADLRGPLIGALAAVPAILLAGFTVAWLVRALRSR